MDYGFILKHLIYILIMPSSYWYCTQIKISLFVLSFRHGRSHGECGFRLAGRIRWSLVEQIPTQQKQDDLRVLAKPPPVPPYLQHIQTLDTSASTLCQLWFHVFNTAFSSFWRAIRLSSLWECSVVETYVGQPPQQMSNSRLQHATSAAIPTSSAFSWAQSTDTLNFVAFSIFKCHKSFVNI